MNFSFKSKIKFKPFLLLISFFLFINILYYFLRFQFNTDQEVLIIYTINLVLISFLALLNISNILANKDKINFIVLICLTLLFISLYLLVITFFRSPQISTIFYSLKDFIFPQKNILLMVDYNLMGIQHNSILHLVLFLLDRLVMHLILLFLLVGLI